MTFTQRLFRTAAPIALLITGLAGCSRQDPAPTNQTILTWTVDSRTVSTVFAMQTTDGPDITVEGSIDASQGGAAMVLRMPKRLGTYTLAPNNWDVYAAYSGDGLYRSANGSITVSTLTATVIKGTFTFTGTGNSNPSLTKTITQGTFSAAL
jgi:hypothetical protein